MIKAREYFKKKKKKRRTKKDHFWDNIFVKSLTWCPRIKPRFNESNLYDEFHNLMHDVNFKGNN